MWNPVGWARSTRARRWRPRRGRGGSETRPLPQGKEEAAGRTGMPSNRLSDTGGGGAAPHTDSQREREPKWKVLATVRRLDDTTGEWAVIQLKYAGEQLCLSRQRKRSGEYVVEEMFPFRQITHLLFGPTIMCRIFADYPKRKAECDAWCCMSFRTQADTTYDIAAQDSRAARAVFHKLRAKSALPPAGRTSPAGHLLWYTTRLRLEQQAERETERDRGKAMRGALRQAVSQSWRDRVRWEAGADDWRQLRLLAMSAIDRDQVFARGANDAETCAPFPPRGVLPLDQAKECVRLQLPGGGPDGKGPQGGTALPLCPLPADAAGRKGAPPTVAISAIAEPCWVWAFAAARPVDPADAAWRKQLQTAHAQAKSAQEAMAVKFFDGRTQTEVLATVLSAHAVNDHFVVRLEDGQERGTKAERIRAIIRLEDGRDRLRRADEPRVASSGPALGDLQFRNFLEYLCYFQQAWPRFSGLEQILHGPGLHKNRPLGQYEFAHAVQMLLGGVDR